VLFSSGFPDGNVTWTLTDQLGSQVGSGSLTPNAGDVSVTIEISATNNALSGTLFGWRDLTWSYTTGGVAETGHKRYTLEGTAPFGAREEGVRSKLGISDADLADEDVPLMKAYLDFQHVVSADQLAVVDTSSAYNLMTICDAIEATAALAVLPSLQVRVAASESSGTNQYKRQDIDWAAVADKLHALVDAGQQLVNPSLALESDTSMFVLSNSATDLFPGG
jgi:hypothetical protein